MIGSKSHSTERIHMARCKVIYLTIVSGLLLLLSAFPAFADVNDANETNSNPPTTENTLELLESEITLNINFLTSMLLMLDLNLNLISKTLDDHLEEYPFLKSTKEGADEGVKGVDSILAAFGVSPANLNDANDTNVTPHSLNETLSQINSSLQYPDGMIENANSTMGEPNLTTPMIKDMFKSMKTMTELINQY
jgi:hypothetical protein